MVKVYESSIVANTNVFFALSDDDYQYSRAQIMMQRGDSIRGVVSINAVFYVTTANFTTGTNFLLASISESLLWPTAYQAFPGVEMVTASIFHDATGAAFGSTQVLDKASIIINKSGNIYAYVNTITTPATLAAVDYIIIPVCVSFTKILDVVNT